MPAELQASPGTPLPTVAVSALCELAYALFAIEVLRQTPDNRRQPWARELLDERPDLAGRVAGFWDDGYVEWTEIIIAARRSGTLLDEMPTRFFAVLDSVLTEPIEVPELPTESPEVRGILAARFERLRRSADLRARYTTLLRDVWAFLEERWERQALAVARRAARSLRERLAERNDIRPLLPPHHFALREHLRLIVEPAVERGEVVLTPLAFAGPGISIFGLPGILIVGFGPDASTRLRAGREEAERAASRFKVLSDPTRVAILKSLDQCPYTITDIARMFELSQPTVSVHMKVLREAGLVEPQKLDGQTLYRSSPERTRAYIAKATAEVAPAP